MINRRIKKSLREYKKEAHLTMLLVALEVVFEMLIPLIMSRLIDDGIDKGDLRFVLIAGSIMIGFTLISLLLGILHGRFGAYASAGFSKNLREDVYLKIQTYSFSNIDKFQTSSLITRLTSDIQNIQQFYQMSIRIFIRAPLNLAIALLLSFMINWQLALIFLGVAVFVAPLLVLIVLLAMPVFRKSIRKTDEMNRNIQENVRGIREVKTYVREDYHTTIFKNTSKDLYNLQSKAQKIVAINGPLMQFAIYTSILLLAFLGAQHIVAGTFTTGKLMSFLIYSMTILTNLMMLSMVFVIFMISRASQERIIEVLDEVSDITNPKDPIYEIEDATIEFKNVTFSYSSDLERAVLKNINFTIKEGETIGIIGHTGSSKSTLISLIPRLYDASEGEVLIGGKNVKEYDLVSLRDAVGVVLQKNVLFSGTIKENLKWGNQDATDEEIILASEIAQAAPFINEMEQGYETFIEQGGTNVSGGQKQRLAIARTLLKKPKILILDDSTSAVDTKTDALIQAGLKTHMPGITKIVIAQRIQSVIESDKIIIMENGTVMGFGSHETLLKTNKLYQEIYHAQTRGKAQ